MPTSSEKTRESRGAQAALFAKWLRAAMEAGGYSTVSNRAGGQAQLAEDVGVTPSNLSRWLAGENVPPANTVVRLAEALGSDPLGGLRAGGYPDLADWVEKRTGIAGQPDPALARIERASGLDDLQKAWLIGFYRRHIELAQLEAIKDIKDLIELLERRALGQSA